jgi:hypothetical protein
MFSWLKKHFIPHEGNGDRPHILRYESTRNIILVLLLLEIFTFLIPTLTHINTTINMTAEVLPSVLADLTNGERQTENLPTLTVSPILNEAAQMKANDMAKNGYFAHTSPDGKTPWYWLEQVGYNYQYAGENLAINFSDSKDVTDAWMASPAHRANIVKGNYTDIGTGVAAGTYQGQQTVFVVQDYANPLPVGQTQTKNIKPEVAKVETISSGNVVKESAYVLGAETVSTQKINPIQKPTFWQKLIASPRNTINIILYILSGIITVALLLYIFIKRKNYHIDLITNGLIVLVVLGAVFIGNYYFTHHDMVIAQGLDYSNQSE